MSDNWKTVFEKEVDGRSVKGTIYSEGGYKVRSTQKDDYPGNYSRDGNSHIFSNPSAAGTPFEVDAETLDELEKELIDCGEFTPDQAKEIVASFDA